MRFNKLFAGAAVAVAVLSVSTDAFAAAWMSPSGSTNTFTYSGGKDDKGLFGDPVVVTDGGFSFAPSNFTATSVNGVGAVTTDRMQVSVQALPNGLGISGVALNEIGDYSINDGGDVKEFAYLLVKVLDPGYGPQTLFSVQSNPAFSVDTRNSGADANGEWTDALTVNLPTPARSVVIILNNNLHAGSNVLNGSATITKKFVDGGDQPGLSIIIPEPTTITAGLAALGMLVRRRRSI